MFEYHITKTMFLNICFQTSLFKLIVLIPVLCTFALGPHDGGVAVGQQQALEVLDKLPEAPAAGRRLWRNAA